MKIPNSTDEKYKLQNDFECVKIDFKSYEADVNKFIDKLEIKLKQANKLLSQARDVINDNTDWGSGADPNIKLICEIESQIK